MLAGHLLRLVWVCCRGNAHPLMVGGCLCCMCAPTRAVEDRQEWLDNSYRSILGCLRILRLASTLLYRVSVLKVSVGTVQI